MASQDDDDGPTTVNRMSYPDYERDEGFFESFIRTHEILTVVPDEEMSHDDDGDMMIPTRAGDVNFHRSPCYPPLLQRVKDRHYYEQTPSSFIIEVPLDELCDWDNDKGQDLAARAEKNTLRYHKLFCSVIDKVLSQMDSRSRNNTAGAANVLRDVVEVLHEQRLAQQQVIRESQGETDNNSNNIVLNPFAGRGNLQAENNENIAPGVVMEEFPPILMRRYELRILPLGRRGTLPPFVHQHLPKQSHPASKAVGVALRTIRSQSMGHLVTVTGMIVRASDVKPNCVVATYSCDMCGAEIYQVVENQREFMPQRKCPVQNCGKESLHLQTRGSKFVKFQELKLQELPNQVPMGHVPRSMTVYCRGELTRLAGPGDVVTIDGVFLPQRVAESGYRAMKAGLVSTSFLEAQYINVHKRSYDESLLESLSDDESRKLDAAIYQVATGEDPIGKLASSIAPEIFGHEDIKRSLLLQLVGGCTRTLPDGMRIRGDINICLMGDPGVAKSQLLKHVASIAPRGVYTTGKGSSGVGLTAAVTKDMTTGEMALEGGALVLADQGVCCIDEFDKMDEADRTAIHEVMEQQTVSIAKAGIVATLNARAAVLAAANPLYGRYNRKKSLSENINLPNSLLSRFDLMFLVLDSPDIERDMALAKHVTFVHQNEGLTQKRKEDEDEEESGMEIDNDAMTSPSAQDDAGKNDTLPPHILREYIARARKHQPVIPPEVAPYVVEAYVALRLEDRPRGRKDGDQTAMTARQLLSMLRLSQALARLRFSDFVAREDVDEAIRLTHMSKASLTDNSRSSKGEKGEGRGEDVMSRIFNTIRDYASVSGSREVELKLCEAMVLRKGFTAQQLQACLEEYEELQVIQINRSRTHLYFIDG